MDPVRQSNTIQAVNAQVVEGGLIVASANNPALDYLRIDPTAGDIKVSGTFSKIVSILSPIRETIGVYGALTNPSYGYRVITVAANAVGPGGFYGELIVVPGSWDLSQKMEIKALIQAGVAEGTGNIFLKSALNVIRNGVVIASVVGAGTISVGPVDVVTHLVGIDTIAADTLAEGDIISLYITRESNDALDTFNQDLRFIAGALVRGPCKRM